MTPEACMKKAEETGVTAVLQEIGGRVRIRLPMSDAFLSLPVDELPLSVRARNALMRSNLDTIGKLLKEEDLGSVVSIFLEQQEQVLQEEIADRKDKLDRLEELKSGLKDLPSVSVKSIGDIATVMENKKKLSAVHRKMVLIGLPFTVAEDAGILLWIFKGQWWLFAGALAAAIPVIIWMVRYYYRNAAYICPQCHEVFKPAMKEFFFANHTLKTRKLTCVKCGHKGYCVETYGGNME